MSEPVYRAAGWSIIHTERDCVYLREAKRVIECDPETADGRECRGCQGTEHRKDSQDHSLNSKLHKLAQSDEDVLLTDGGLTNRERVAYYDRLFGTVALAATGGILFGVGLLWGVAGMETFIVETDTGITMVEGGASEGFLQGPALAAIGAVLLSLASFRHIEVSR